MQPADKRIALVSDVNAVNSRVDDIEASGAGDIGEAVNTAISEGGAAESTLTGTIRDAIAAALVMFVPKPPAEDAWAHWGDSLTSASTSGNWVGKFANAAGMASYNGGAGGEWANEITARMLAPEADQYRNRMVTLAAGRNGFKVSSPETIVADIGRMVAHLSVTFKGFIFDVPPWDTEVTGDSNRVKLDTLNAMLRDAFPAVFLPIFASLRTQAAADAAGIVFTSQDNTDISNGVTPSSFRLDGGHLNSAGGTAVAAYLINAARDRGLIPELALHDIGPDDYLSRFYPAAHDPAVGSVVSMLPDFGDGQPLANVSSAAPSIKIASTSGIGKHLRVETVYDTGGRLQRSAQVSDNFTFMAVIRSITQGPDSLRLGRYGFRRARNGQWQLQGIGNILVNGSSDWALVIGVCSGTSSVLSINGVESGPGAITGPATGGDNFDGFGTNSTTTPEEPVELAELAIWDRVLNSSERSRVVAAMRSKYSGLPQS